MAASFVYNLPSILMPITAILFAVIAELAREQQLLEDDDE